MKNIIAYLKYRWKSATPLYAQITMIASFLWLFICNMSELASLVKADGLLSSPDLPHFIQKYKFWINVLALAHTVLPKFACKKETKKEDASEKN